MTSTNAQREQLDSGNARNGTRVKTVLTDGRAGGDRGAAGSSGTFEPRDGSPRNGNGRLTGMRWTMVISLSAKGLTTGEISAHLAEVYGAEVSRQTISTITDKVVAGA